MNVGTINAKAIADHTKMYEKIFNEVNIKDGDSILLITWLHPTYHNTIKKTYPHSLILSIEDISVKFLWRNVLDGVVFLDLEDKESLIKYTKENKMTFDHIIANPPYSLGNQITSTVLNNVDFEEYVNLMPIRYYTEKTYKHLVPNSLVKVSWDGDALVTPWIAQLTKEADSTLTKEDYGTWKWDKRFTKFYLENGKRKHYAIDLASFDNKHTPKSTPSTKTSIFGTKRNIQDGIHFTNDKKPAYDVQWNLYPKKEYDTPEGIAEFKKHGSWIIFNTEKEF